MELTKVQKNELLSTILAGGVNPAECSQETRRANPLRRHSTTIITHLPSGSLLLVTPSSDMYYFVRPGFQRNVKWADVIDATKRWAGEIAQPDFWTELSRDRDLFTRAGYEGFGNTPFTTEEQAAISNQLIVIEAYVKKTYSLSDEQISRVENRLDEAEKASQRIGRKDWLLLFSGTILTLIVTDLVTPDVAHQIFIMALHGLRHLFEGGAAPIERPGIK